MNILYSKPSADNKTFSDPPRVVIAMMFRDETNRLEAWIRYHAKLFDYDALYIYDNGSRSYRVAQILEKYAQYGVHVNYNHYTSADFEAKGEILSKRFIELEKDSRNNFFIPLDCDEFITLRKSDGSLTANRSDILSYLKTLMHGPHTLVARDAHANVLGYPGYFFPAYAHHKVLFTEGCCMWMDEGFHTAKSRKLESELVTDLVYLHFHYRPFEDMVRQSKWKLSHLVDVQDLEKVKEYAGVGFHVAKYLWMNEIDYKNGFNPNHGIYLPWFVSFFEGLDIGREFFASI